MIQALTLPLPLPDRKTLLRYAGAAANAADDPALSSLLEECITELSSITTGWICYGVFPLEEAGEYLHAGFAPLPSRILREHWQDCREVLVFAATVGLTFDRAVTRAAARSPAKALLLDALGTERVEALCDAFCHRMATAWEEKNAILTPRFSPGYGDLPLTFQREIFRSLNCSQHIGLTLNQSLSMSPSKSVTALVGIRYQTP